MCRLFKRRKGKLIWVITESGLAAEEGEILSAPKWYSRKKTYRVLMTDPVRIEKIEEDDIRYTKDEAENTIYNNAVFEFNDQIKRNIPLSQQLITEEFTHYMAIFFREIIGIVPDNVQRIDPRTVKDEEDE